MKLYCLGRFVLRSLVFFAILRAAPLLAEPAHPPPSLSSTTDALTDGQTTVWQAVVAEFRHRNLIGPQWPQIDDLELAASESANSHPLRVTSLCWDKRAQRVQLRLECEEAGQCLPFLAYVRRDQSLEQLERDGSGHDFEHSGLPVRLDICGTSSGSRSLPIPKKAAIQPGDQAAVFFQAEGLRMTASVKCLERGSPGEIIRVRGQDGHIFRARILGPKRLEFVTQQESGRLPDRLNDR